MATVKVSKGNENVRKAVVAKIKKALENAAMADKEVHMETQPEINPMENAGRGRPRRGGVGVTHSVPQSWIKSLPARKTAPQLEIENQMSLMRRAVKNRSDKVGGTMTGGTLTGGTLTGGTMTGGRKVAKAKKEGNPWVEFCKTWAKTNGISYREAMMDPACKAKYSRS